jgi:hypothetical protein
MDFITEAKDKNSFHALPLRYMRAFGWIAYWARNWIRARLWHAIFPRAAKPRAGGDVSKRLRERDSGGTGKMAPAFVFGLGVGALL